MTEFTGAFGEPTGRKFIADNTLGGELVNAIPDHDDWNEYWEYKDADGEFWYSSGNDEEHYTLSADEFGPIADGMDLSEVLNSLDGRDGDGTPYGRGGDWCPWCGADWKAQHDVDCTRPSNE